MKKERKKVLIITYYWPPAGGPGVQRWLKFVKYLPDFDIEPIVYIPENPTYPILDSDLENDVSKQATILRKRIFEPYRIASIFGSGNIKKISKGIIPHQRKQSFFERASLWIRGNLFIPDARVFWVKPSITYLDKYIKENKIETIISTGPPHSVHLIGLGLKKLNNITWIADFRDPWTTIGYHKSLKLTAQSQQRHISLEKEVLNTADSVIVTSRTTKVEFSKITSKPIEIITNGYDAEKVQKKALDTKFSLAHIGSFLSERNPRILWKALKELIKEEPGFADNFELKLAGAVSPIILANIDEFGLTKFLNNLGYLAHKEAVAEQRAAQVLLLIEIDSEETNGIIPGKIFEYMVSGRPVIGIGPDMSDFAEIITETNTGVFINYDEKDKLKETILAYYTQYLQGNLKSNAVGLQKYSRKNLTSQLAQILKK
ncbi:glycosyltransferase family 4 protein [Flavobacterium ardleyense]|uniref:glycosyltransferase family 4 protein n=1 Tax=Flavobacterium ardleyense TaxID=2038737 RepID=UPI00298D11A1|nr:glycosyltransferase family 4 protein [Flavobacterium ardleyense]